MIANANSIRIPLKDRSVHCCVTSPPYWGLRSYLAEDDPLKVHELGTESTPEAYVAHLVTVFREVKRVLRDDATLWLNLGDSFSPGGVLANLNNILSERIKEGVIFLGPGCSLTITSKSDGILEHDELPPENIFLSLLGVQRVSVKQGDDNLCQILDGFAPIADCRISPSIIATVDKTNAELILDVQDDIRIVISDLNLYADAALEVSVFPGATEYGQASLSIKEAREPIAKSIGNTETARNTISLDSVGECLPEVDSIDNPVTLTDALVTRAKRFGDLSVTKASPEQITLLMMDGRIELAARSVAHLFVSNSCDSLVRYAEVYHKAEQKANERKAKQELGIPGMVKRALMRDGWICRNTIIWHKPNPMPESVTDRCTKSHEYLFLLAKSKRYFYDAEAVKEDGAGHQWSSRRGFSEEGQAKRGAAVGHNNGAGFHSDEKHTGRNRRTVWTIATRAYRGAHFATFPPALVAPCILAGTSKRGVCPECGAPWERVVENQGFRPTHGVNNAADDARGKHGSNSVFKTGQVPVTATTGWRPTCTCGTEHPMPQADLDADPSLLDDFEIEPFATFPPALVAPCILAGTSKRGVCPECGAPWERVVEKKSLNPWSDRVKAGAGSGSLERGYNENHGNGMSHDLGSSSQTTGWHPTCEHWPREDLWLEYPHRIPGDPVPATVLDPFCGSGTTGEVCRETGRRFYGLDLSARYLRDFALVRAEHKQTAASIAALPLFEL